MCIRDRALIPFGTLIVVNFIVNLFVSDAIGAIINLAGAVWYGLMFDTWFKNQLIANGYHIGDKSSIEDVTDQHDFE